MFWWSVLFLFITSFLVSTIGSSQLKDPIWIIQYSGWPSLILIACSQDIHKSRFILFKYSRPRDTGFSFEWALKREGRLKTQSTLYWFSNSLSPTSLTFGHWACISLNTWSYDSTETYTFWYIVALVRSLWPPLWGSILSPKFMRLFYWVPCIKLSLHPLVFSTYLNILIKLRPKMWACSWWTQELFYSARG